MTTFGVVVLSILTQGLSMAPLLRRLGVVGDGETHKAYELARGQLRTARVARQEIDTLAGSAMMDRTLVTPLEEEYDARIREAEARLRDLHLERSDLRETELRRARRHLLIVEKEQVLESYHQGILGRDAYERLLADIDGRVLRLDEGEEADAS